MKYNLLLLLLTMCALPVIAQDDNARSIKAPRHAIKISPLHAANHFPTLQIAYEKSIYRNYTMQVDYGYVFDDREDEVNFKNLRGFKIKLENRFYFHQSQNEHVLLYGAFELYKNFIDFERYRWKLECFDEDCVDQYRRYREFRIENRERGMTIKFGTLFNFNRFLMDLNSGLTIRTIRYNKPPEYGTRTYDEIVGSVNERNRTIPYPNFGFRIGYLIR